MPLLAVDPGSRRPAWQQVVEAIGAAIRSGMLAAGEPLPSVREMSARQDVPVANLPHALAVLADEGLVVVRQGRTAVVAGDAATDRRSGRAPRDRDHDCKRAGCRPHVCKPDTRGTDAPGSRDVVIGKAGGSPADRSAAPDCCPSGYRDLAPYSLSK